MGNEILPPSFTAISCTLEAISDSRMPGCTIRIAVTCISTVVSTAFSISRSSSSDLISRCATTALISSTDAAFWDSSGLISSQWNSLILFSARYGGNRCIIRPFVTASFRNFSRSGILPVFSIPAFCA